MDAKMELERLGFRHVGAILPCDSGSRCRAEIEEVRGFVVYAHVVENVIKKFGITKPSLKARVNQNVSTINGVIALNEGRSVGDAVWHHRSFDAFKRMAPDVIRSNQEIEIWVLECSSSEMMAETETGLNTTYAPEWTKEGSGRGRPDRDAETDLLSLRCECGCGAGLRRRGFAPGHDQKLRIRIEGRVGGLLALRDLMDRLEQHANGASNAEELSSAVRIALRRAEGAG